MLRAAVGVVAALGLTWPAATAVAEDDPQPADWPSVEQPMPDESASDPQPGGWPTIAPPQAGDGQDPAPPDWPAPSPE